MSESVHYLFDVDGTLTKPRGKMDSSFTMRFLKWMEGKSVFLVSGSNMEKIKQQMPHSITTRCAGISCSMGNELWVGNELKYKNIFEPPKALIEMLSSFQVKTSSPVLGEAPFIEYRTGMLNFTTIGRNSSNKKRLAYYAWDKESKERIRISDKIEKAFPDLEAKLGGQISIDIQPKGRNKSQVSKWIRKNLDGKIIFFGDKCAPKGNDYDIYVDVKKNGGESYSVKSPIDTLKLLEKN